MAHRIDKTLINISEIARRVGISQPYASQLINGERKGKRAKERLKELARRENTKSVAKIRANEPQYSEITRNILKMASKLNSATTLDTIAEENKKKDEIGGYLFDEANLCLDILSEIAK